jgi:hypothetical protein
MTDERTDYGEDLARRPLAGRSLSVLFEIRWILLIVVLVSMGVEGKAADRPAGFAVVELFTSEGCSSCPPADRVLGELDRRRAKGEPILCLGFHVDYWDKLGWKDEFSQPEATARQSAYCRRFKLKEVYTPQMVVNGSAEFLGSNARAADDAVKAALKTPSKHTLTLLPAAGEAGSQVDVRFRADGETAEYFVLAALVQKQDTNQVLQGENSGKRLAHVRIVRTFGVAAIDDAHGGEIPLTIPDGLKPGDLEIVGLIQHRETGQIVAAQNKPLPAAASRNP